MDKCAQKHMNQLNCMTLIKSLVCVDIVASFVIQWFFFSRSLASDKSFFRFVSAYFQLYFVTVAKIVDLFWAHCQNSVRERDSCWLFDLYASYGHRTNKILSLYSFTTELSTLHTYTPSNNGWIKFKIYIHEVSVIHQASHTCLY